MNSESVVEKKGFSGLQVTGIVLLTMLVTVLLGWWIVRTYIFPSQLEPVELSQSEQVELGRKLKRLGIVTDTPAAARDGVALEQGGMGARPEAYSEDDGKREVLLSEREVNGFLARDPDLASNLAIDLADDLVSFTFLLPIPADFPIMPGRTLRLRGGAEVAFAGGRPVIAIKGFSVMGVPVPNAWMGNFKNVDLVEQFGGDDGFWKAFAEGVEEIRVQDGQLKVKLRE